MVDHAETKRSQTATAIPTLEIGSVLLFSGLTELEDRIQKTLQSFWTRSAVIVPGPDNSPVVLQGTSRPIASDLIDGDTRSGVQIVAVRDMFTSFAGSIAFRAQSRAPRKAVRAVLRAAQRLLQRPVGR